MLNSKPEALSRNPYAKAMVLSLNSEAPSDRISMDLSGSATADGARRDDRRLDGEASKGSGFVV